MLKAQAQAKAREIDDLTIDHLQFTIDKMRNILLMILVGLLMGGCMTDKRIARNCDRFAKVCGQDERQTIYKDTTVVIDVNSK